jgi:hypothetical protein
MEEIFAEADEERRAMATRGRCMTSRPALVGFAMISGNIPQPMDDDLIGPYYLWAAHRPPFPAQRLRRGDARRGRRLLADPARRRRVSHQLRGRPWLAARFYLRYGFADTGRVMWGEACLLLTAARHTSARRRR